MAKCIYTEKYDVFALKGGMFVSSLDIPWSQTKYPIKGFLIRTQQQIDELTDICNYVYVDHTRSMGIKSPVNYRKNNVPTKTKRVVNKTLNRSKYASKKIAERRNSFGTERYPVTVSFKKELRLVEQILDESHDRISHLLLSRQELTRSDVSSIKRFTSDIVASAIRNPQAITWLCKIQNADKKTYNGLVSSSITGILFARQIGLTRDKIEILAQALMLRGIGLIKIKKSHLIAYRPGDKDADYFRHIDLTLEELSKFGNCHDLVSNTIENYAERIDGTGYPSRKSGIRIPLLSQMMGIVSFYENSVSPWVESRAVSPAQAISNLFAVSDKLFAKDLLEQFVQTIGIYPVGCFVKLSDSTNGVVIEQHCKHRLSPVVAIVKNSNGVLLHDPKVIDLYKYNQKNNLTIRNGIASSSIPFNLSSLSSEMLTKNSGNVVWYSPKTWLKLIA